MSKDLTREELRDYFAARVEVPYNKAMMFLITIKNKGVETPDKKDMLSVLLGLQDEKVTLGELAEMRAMMKYIEAHAMMRMRDNDLKEPFIYIKELMNESSESEGDKGRWEGILNG